MSAIWEGIGGIIVFLAVIVFIYYIISLVSKITNTRIVSRSGETIANPKDFDMLNQAIKNKVAKSVVKPLQEEKVYSNPMENTNSNIVEPAIHNSFSISEKEAFICCLYVSIYDGTDEKITSNQVFEIVRCAKLIDYEVIDLLNLENIDLFLLSKIGEHLDRYTDMIKKFNRQQQIYFMSALHMVHRAEYNQSQFDALLYVLEASGLEFEEYISLAQSYERIKSESKA